MEQLDLFDRESGHDSPFFHYDSEVDAEIREWLQSLPRGGGRLELAFDERWKEGIPTWA